MLTAKDIMTKEVITVKPDTSIEELSALLMKHAISGVPVVDDSGNLYGIVTENDLISRNKRLHIPTVVGFLDAAIYLESSKKFEEELRRLAAVRVGGICARKVVTITEDTTLVDIATIMDEKKVHLLPVVKSGKVVGIVSSRSARPSRPSRRRRSGCPGSGRRARRTRGRSRQPWTRWTAPSRRPAMRCARSIAATIKSMSCGA